MGILALGLVPVVAVTSERLSSWARTWASTWRRSRTKSGVPQPSGAEYGGGGVPDGSSPESSDQLTSGTSIIWRASSKNGLDGTVSNEVEDEDGVPGTSGGGTSQSAASQSRSGDFSRSWKTMAISSPL